MPFRRLAAALAGTAAAISVPAVALAHVELTSTDPTAAAALDEPPTAVVLTFDGELEPDGSSFTVTDMDGREVGSGGVDLEVADRNVLSGDVSLLGDGDYTVEWTATSVDGHAQTGSFGFRVGPERPSPDTGLPGPAPARALGALLIAVALLLTGRRAIAREAAA